MTLQFFNILDEQVHLDFNDLMYQPERFKIEFIDTFLNSCNKLEIAHVIYFLEVNPYTRDTDFSKFIYGLVKLYLWARELNILETISKEIIFNGCNQSCKWFVFCNPSDQDYKLFAFITDIVDEKIISITQCKSFIV